MWDIFIVKLFTEENALLKAFVNCILFRTIPFNSPYLYVPSDAKEGAHDSPIYESLKSQFSETNDGSILFEINGYEKCKRAASLLYPSKSGIF